MTLFHVEKANGSPKVTIKTLLTEKLFKFAGGVLDQRPNELQVPS